MEFNNPSRLIKDIAIGKEGRDKLMKGIDQLANTVKVTLGATGHTVIYQNAQGNPEVTKDGVTVATTVVLWDPVEDMGATMIREAASKTVEVAGDGTTTATVLAQAMVHAFNEEIEKGTSVRVLTQGVYNGLQKVIEYLEGETIEVTDEILSYVAAISCNNDHELGSLIAKAYRLAGANGEVMIEDSEKTETSVDNVQGAQLQVGLKSQYWKTNMERDTAELEEPYVLILTSPLNSLRKIESILETCVKQDRSLLIVGELEQQPLATLLANKVKGVVKVNVIDLPGFGPTKQDSVKDLAIVTGATPISEELGDDANFLDVSVLGTAVRATSSAKNTVLQVEAPSGLVSERIAAVHAKMDKETNPYIKKKLQERLGILAGSVSLIKVGAESKLELKEKKDRIEDAVYAVKAAIKEGIVPGGGVSLFNAALTVLNVSSPGERALRKAIQAPFFTILENAHTVLAEPVLKQLAASKGTGIDVVTGEIVDMIKHGIIDPVLVTKTALKNAVSVTTTIVSAGAVISNKIQG